MISEHWFWSDKSASGSPVAQARGQEMAVSRQAVYAAARPATDAPSAAPREYPNKRLLVRHSPSKSCQRGVRVGAARSGGCHGR
jgi:hypothetical protein